MAKREPHPATQIAALRKELGGAQGMRRGYLFKGDERYFVEQGIEALLAAANEAGYEIVRHDGDDPEFAPHVLLDDLSGAPMFSAGRLIVVRGATKALAGGKDGPVSRAMVAWLENAAQSGSLVLAGSSLRADNVVAKRIVKADGIVVGCRKLFDTPAQWRPDPLRTELVEWLLARAKELGMRLEPERAAYVANAVGNDLFALDDALAKLGRSKDRHVAEVVEYRGNATPWSVADLVCRGEFTPALAGITMLFRAGTKSKDGRRVAEVPALVAMFLGALRKNVTQAARAARALQRGETPNAAAKAAGVPGYPKALEAFAAQMSVRPASDWARLERELTLLERASRSGPTVDEHDLIRLALSWRVKRARPGRAQTRARA